MDNPVFVVGERVKIHLSHATLTSDDDEAALRGRGHNLADYQGKVGTILALPDASNGFRYKVDCGHREEDFEGWHLKLHESSLQKIEKPANDKVYLNDSPLEDLLLLKTMFGVTDELVCALHKRVHDDGKRFSGWDSIKKWVKTGKKSGDDALKAALKGFGDGKIDQWSESPLVIISKAKPKPPKTEAAVLVVLPPEPRERSSRGAAADVSILSNIRIVDAKAHLASSDPTTWLQVEPTGDFFEYGTDGTRTERQAALVADTIVWLKAILQRAGWESRMGQLQDRAVGWCLGPEGYDEDDEKPQMWVKVDGNWDSLMGSTIDVNRRNGLSGQKVALPVQIKPRGETKSLYPWFLKENAAEEELLRAQRAMEADERREEHRESKKQEADEALRAAIEANNHEKLKEAFKKRRNWLSLEVHDAATTALQAFETEETERKAQAQAEREAEKAAEKAAKAERKVQAQAEREAEKEVEKAAKAERKAQAQAEREAEKEAEKTAKAERKAQEKEAEKAERAARKAMMKEEKTAAKEADNDKAAEKAMKTE